MKVAINTLFLIPGEVGGSETYMCETVQAVCREQPEIQLVFITNEENDATLRTRFGSFAQCGFHCLPVRATNRYARILAEQSRLPFAVRRIRPDVLWSPGYTMPFRAPCRQVVSILDMQYRSHPEDLTWLARWTTHLLVTMSTRRADRILTISDFSRREIVRHAGCPPDKIHVTPLGVDPAFASPPATPGTGHLSPDTRHAIRDTPYLLCVANSYPHKNLARLVAAFAMIMTKIPHQLVLVGRPRLGEPELRRALERISSERVKRVAGLCSDELIALYQAADLFIFPSLYEGFGLPVLEAMMAGVPVITTREGAIPEVGGDHVLYADGRDPADLAAKMEKVLGWSDEKRGDWIRNARKRAKTFTWSEAAAATVEGWHSSLRS